MPTGKLGKLWERNGKVYAYSYSKGKKAGRKLLRFYELTPKDLKRIPRRVKKAGEIAVLLYLLDQAAKE